MKIIYDEHLEQRLNEREFPQAWPQEIIENPDEVFHDQETESFVAIALRNYKGRQREIAVIYTQEQDEQRVITIHPLKQGQKTNRIQTKRWKKL